MNKHRNYEIKARPLSVGGGWKLTLFEDGQEAGGGVFPVDEAGSHRALFEAYGQAQDQGEAWIGAR